MEFQLNLNRSLLTPKTKSAIVTPNSKDMSLCLKLFLIPSDFQQTLKNVKCLFDVQRSKLELPLTPLNNELLIESVELV